MFGVMVGVMLGVMLGVRLDAMLGVNVGRYVVFNRGSSWLSCWEICSV